MIYRFKEIREMRGMTQQDAAEKLGVTTAFISRIEKGDKNPTFPFAVSMAKCYGVTVNDFVSNSVKFEKY